MAFKFVVFLAVVATTYAASSSFWPNGHGMQHRMWREQQPGDWEAVSNSWQWNGNLERQLREQDWRRDQQQDQWMWNRNWANDNNMDNQWNNDDDWQNQQRQWRERNWARNNNGNDRRQPENDQDRRRRPSNDSDRD